MARIRGYRRKNDYRGFLILIFFVAIVGLVYFASKSDIFEQEMPEILFQEELSHWNPHKKFPVTFRDKNGIKEYTISITLSNGHKAFEVKEVVLDKPKELQISLPIPPMPLEDGMQLRYAITLTDWSNAPFFGGNTVSKELSLTIDATPPSVEMLASSFAITYGGSALVVFKAKDANLKSVIFSNGVDEFRPFPYIAEGYYALLVAWPIKNKNFSPLILAVDQANNETKYRVAIVKRTRGYRESNLKLQEKNFDKIDAMLKQINKKSPESFSDQSAKFYYLNEVIRQEDESEIYQAATNFPLHLIAKAPNFERFYPLKGGQVVGSYGDLRHYYYRDKNISNSYHLGLDMASIKHAPILLSNAGRVVLEKNLGLYGNTVVIYHGLGLSSSYSHISHFNCKLNENLPAGSTLAYTGSTGWAFGDHLHFGMIVQGHFVRLSEWMDSKWIKNNITGVLQKGEKAIKEQIK